MKLDAKWRSRLAISHLLPKTAPLVTSCINSYFRFVLIACDKQWTQKKFCENIDFFSAPNI